MERINLSVLSGASHDGMLQLKSYVDMTGTDQQHQSYDYECLFPETCNPREICLSFIKTANGYTFRVNPHFRYDGNNAVMGLLADQGAVSFSSWQDAEQALRSLSEEGTKPTISNATPDTLTDWNAISVPEPSESKTPNFEHLKERLQKMVIGQDDSTEAIAYVVAQHLAKKNPTKPVSILASGPPGVGKSETAKALAKILSQDCGQEYAVSWTDLNNFTEAFSVYRLIGAPAGYVGYEDEAVFEVVERNPYTIFIFDELDKAHPEVLKTFMAILDEGRCASRKALNDGSREFDFKHCIIDEDVFNLVQVELQKRSKMRRGLRNNSPFCTKLICGDCGSFYGHKIFHAKEKHSKDVWYCNQRYQGNNNCSTPILAEDDLVKYYLQALSKILENKDRYVSACKAQMDEAEALEKIRRKREKAETSLAKDMAKIQALVRENAYISQDQQVYRQRFEEMSKHIEQQKIHIAEFQEQELRLVGIREKLSRFIDALGSFDVKPTFDSVTWNSLIERVLVNPRNLIFEFKNGEKIKITI